MKIVRATPIPVITAAILTAASLCAQAPQPAARPARVRPSAYPERAPADPAVVERGKALYSVHCGFCHGADARGGSGGINLIRAEAVLSDKDGEVIGPVLRQGREGMPKFDLTPAQVSDVAAFIHSFKVSGYDQSRMTPTTIVVGNARKGEAFFQKTCSGCHSLTGDLKGIGARMPDAKMLQQTWLMPGSGGGRFGEGGGVRVRVPPATVTVMLADGRKAQGVLNRIDDFFVTLTDSEGFQRTFSRNGDVPKVELHDPLKPHRELLRTYQDDDIHDLTAFLVNVK